MLNLLMITPFAWLAELSVRRQLILLQSKYHTTFRGVQRSQAAAVRFTRSLHESLSGAPLPVAGRTNIAHC
jgi:hypothetical protein